MAACPRRGWLLWGVKPVILAVVVQALWKLAPAAARSWPLRGLGLLAAGAAVAGVNEIAVLLVAGAAGGRRSRAASRRAAPARTCGSWFRALPVAAAPAAASAVSLSGLFGRVPEDRLGPVRQRVRAAGVPARRSGAAAALADGGATHRRHRGRGRSRRGPSSPRPPSSATSCRGPAARWSPPPASSCRRSSSWRPAARWCRACVRSRLAGAFLDGVNVGVAGADGRRDRAVGAGGHR